MHDCLMRRSHHDCADLNMGPPANAVGYAEVHAEISYHASSGARRKHRRTTERMRTRITECASTSAAQRWWRPAREIAPVAAMRDRLGDADDRLRRRLWRMGMGVAEEMDTAKRTGTGDRTLADHRSQSC